MTDPAARPPPPHPGWPDPPDPPGRSSILPAPRPPRRRSAAPAAASRASRGQRLGGLGREEKVPTTRRPTGIPGRLRCPGRRLRRSGGARTGAGSGERGAAPGTGRLPVLRPRPSRAAPGAAGGPPARSGSRPCSARSSPARADLVPPAPTGEPRSLPFAPHVPSVNNNFQLVLEQPNLYAFLLISCCHRCSYRTSNGEKEHWRFSLCL